LALFPQSFIDEVRSAADIVTVVSDYVSLRKAGTAYKGLCPFHAEKSPSFSVNRDRGFFHCFGCNAGGDVFKFVELQEKVNFTDAVRQLAQRFGIPVPELESSDEGRESTAEREALLTMHDVAAAYFREQLAAPGAESIRTYLREGRRLTPATVDALGLGYAPPSRDGLKQRLIRQGFSPVLAVRSGLVTRRDDGTEVDRFRNRLMIPIARDSGSIIAFGGRAMEKDQNPKYLNSPETPIYSKSRILYGLHLTRSEIRKAKLAIIVEGYFDFAQLFQAGGLPAVATCGTALTTAQANLLQRFASKAVLCFDPDTAGQNAAERSGELLVSEGFDVTVPPMPGGMDPDTFLQAEGREGFVGLLRKSKPYLDFRVDRAAAGKDLTRSDGQRAFVRDMQAFAARVVRDPIVLDQLADRVAHKARVSVETVRAAFRPARTSRSAAPTVPASAPAGPLRDVERGLLWAMVHQPEELAAALRQLEMADLEGLRSQDVLEKARQTARSGKSELPNAVMERLTDQEAQLLARVATDREPPVSDLGECVRELRFGRIRRQILALQQEIDDHAAAGRAEARLDELLREKNALSSQMEQARRGPREGYNK
jgi:DNA primase